MEVHTDTRATYACAPDELWRALSSVESYQLWWPWLEHFDGDAFAVGERWACTVRPPLRYRVRFTVHFDEVDAPHRAGTTIDGDIRGTASLTVLPAGDGSELHLISTLAPASGPLRLASLAPPVARWGHDWIISTGLRQFSERAL